MRQMRFLRIPECSISGKVPEFPVVTKRCPHVFEKDLIEKYILEHGSCPICGQPLTMDDLLPVILTDKIADSDSDAYTYQDSDSDAYPYPDSDSDAYPDSEWVAFSDLDSISTSVTQNDSSSTAKESVFTQMPYRISRCIDRAHNSMSGWRKYCRKVSPSLASTDSLRGYILRSRYTLHNTIMPGILSLDIHSSKDNIIATGGADSNAIIFNRWTGKTISTLIGHSEQVTCVKFVKKSELIVTGSDDNTVRVWQWSEDGSYKCMNILKDHTAKVRAVTIHPAHKYLVTASLDCTWYFYDLSDLRFALARGTRSESCTSAAFHPDGHIIGTGSSNFVRFWDVNKQDPILKIDAPGPVTSISFSENGYFLATAARDDVKLWDLRFLRTLKTFKSDVRNTRSVDFDHTGSYLATGGECISVYDIAGGGDFKSVKTFPDTYGIGNISSVKFGKYANYIAAGSRDSDVLIFAPLEEHDSMES